MQQKTGVKPSTVAGYLNVLHFLEKDEFGHRIIKKVKISDAKLWLIRLQNEGKGYSTIHTIRGVLRPAFQMAVDDDLIHKNPFEFQLATVVVKDSVMRKGVTRKQESLYLDFVKADDYYSRYYEGIYILFKTGLRISEFAGLTINDIDMKERKIYVNHQLVKTKERGYVIETTKTAAGVRSLPMSDDVYECFKKILKNRNAPEIEPMIDGYAGFLYFDKNGNPLVAMHWTKCCHQISDKYNRTYKEPIPIITPHVCRHTYCSNMARSGMNPKVLQYLMGHSDIGITMNTYTHLDYQDAKAELKRISK